MKDEANEKLKSEENLNPKEGEGFSENKEELDLIMNAQLEAEKAVIEAIQDTGKNINSQ